MRTTGLWRLPVWRTLTAVVRPTPRCRGVSTTAGSGYIRRTAPETVVRLRDYQEECIQSVLASFGRGLKRVGISLATGAGKTVIFTQLLDRVPSPRPGATQTLILAHRRELVEQAARHCTLAYPHKTVEVEMGAQHASGVADITVASVQSLTSGGRLAKFDPNRFKLVLVDEAHHIVAAGYMRTLRHFGLADSVSSRAPDVPALVGVSATFSRFDGLALGAAIDEIVYHRDYVDMIADGWLSHVVFTTVASTADLSRVRSAGIGQDFRAGDLARAVNTPTVNDITVRTWLAKAAAAGRRSTLVFCVDRTHVADLAAAFRHHGVDARCVTANTDKSVRGRCLDAFKRGEFPVLVNCGVFTEGTDMPNVDCVVLARPTKSRNLLIQMIGRGMRLHDGKTDCHVIDMVASLETGVVTTPTLFGLDPGELLTAASVKDMRALKEQRETVAAETDAERQPSDDGAAADTAPIQGLCFTEYNSVLDLIADTSGERHIRALSQHAWVEVGEGRYILSGPTGTYLRIEQVNGDGLVDGDDLDDVDPSLPHSANRCVGAYRITETRALPPGVAKSSPFAAPRELCRSPTFADAVHAADHYASKIFPRPFVYRHQGWRSEPATQGQLDFLNKVRAGFGTPLVAQRRGKGITRGIASDMITKIKHGARRRFANIKSSRRREEKLASATERQRMQRLREEVTVGPLSV